MDAMSQGRLAPLLSLMAEDVIWRWMGAGQWSRSFEGKQAIIDTLFDGATDDLAPASRIEVAHLFSDGNHVVVEHSGYNVLPDGRNYNNQYCWVLRFDGDVIREVREYMDTQLVTETFGTDQGPSA